ncbi:hypothetical protein E4T48_01677 [Aureobasidium sp. EXF-10727]|nr:hypothetical protein E4T48_01677 [Aureobasidium sp. EXF-10727]
MADAQVTLRTRKFIRNPLLARKQMVVLHVNLRPWKREARGGPDDIQHCAAVREKKDQQRKISSSNHSAFLRHLFLVGKAQTQWSTAVAAEAAGTIDLLYIEIHDVLHPNRPNVSKDELRQKLSELYKADKDQVSVFGFRTQYGGGKSTGFALIYDSNEAMKKFEPHYRLVRVGMANKIEKASRQQRKQRKNRMKTLTGTAKVKGAKTKKDK